jgi:hypothetical protein
LPDSSIPPLTHTNTIPQAASALAQTLAMHDFELRSHNVFACNSEMKRHGNVKRKQIKIPVIGKTLSCYPYPRYSTL